MAWIIDTCLLIDILDNDPRFGASSAKLIDSKRATGLSICPITYIELSPAFRGDAALQNQFLDDIGIQWQESWTSQDTATAHQTWTIHTSLKRTGHIGKRPIADILIGSFAMRFQGLITRNPKDFHSVLPRLKLVTP